MRKSIMRFALTIAIPILLTASGAFAQTGSKPAPASADSDQALREPTTLFPEPMVEDSRNRLLELPSNHDSIC